ncbi:MAG: hypothetical protein ACRDQI_11320 [Pseudonocardiaceae bacterium]
MDTTVRHIGIFLFAEVEELDAIGPWEVLAHWTLDQRVHRLTSLRRCGLLRGRPATTYWRALANLQELEPTVQLRPDARFVDDGDVITSAGVSAGIDMALHLVARLAGVQRAKQVQRGIQYDPQPPV